ncbi:hypothetical protein ACIBSW_19305 [Actinoplanes sp. NPDC049668]|uniref:hypothetical protein n=1 Tax=unclassified Actinoplanes TaxID=2626549 RepID=UPI0033A1B979
MRWDEYAEASRRLAELRGRESSRQAQTQQRVAAGRASVEQLRKRLDAQADHLVGLSTRLREATPATGGVARTGLTDLDEAVRQAWEAIGQADTEARQAEERATRPALLPGMSPTGRGVLVYATATTVMWLVSCGLFTLSPDSGGTSAGLLLWSLCGLPAIAFFGGYLTLAIFGRSRVEPAGQDRYSKRLGGLICFLGMLLGWILYVAISALL